MQCFNSFVAEDVTSAGFYKDQLSVSDEKRAEEQSDLWPAEFPTPRLSSPK